MKTNTFFKNTMVILFTSFVIKLLGLLNKIIIIDGMSLYVLTMPTLILLTSISSLSLNSVISKLISENEVSHQYSNKALLKKSILLSLISSLITIVILLIIIKPLTNKSMQNNKNPIILLNLKLMIIERRLKV